MNRVGLAVAVLRAVGLAFGVHALLLLATTVLLTPMGRPSGAVLLRAQVVSELVYAAAWIALACSASFVVVRLSTFVRVVNVVAATWCFSSALAILAWNLFVPPAENDLSGMLVLLSGGGRRSAVAALVYAVVGLVILLVKPSSVRWAIDTFGPIRNAEACDPGAESPPAGAPQGAESPRT
jgi:hypothetical protein